MHSDSIKQRLGELHHMLTITVPSCNKPDHVHTDTCGPSFQMVCEHCWSLNPHPGELPVAEALWPCPTAAAFYLHDPMVKISFS